MAPQNIFSESDRGGRSSILSVGWGGAGGGPDPSPASSAAASNSSASLLSAWEGPSSVMEGEGSLLICRGRGGRSRASQGEEGSDGDMLCALWGSCGWSELGLGALRLGPTHLLRQHVSPGPQAGGAQRGAAGLQGCTDGRAGQVGEV